MGKNLKYTWAPKPASDAFYNEVSDFIDSLPPTLLEGLVSMRLTSVGGIELLAKDGRAAWINPRSCTQFQVVRGKGALVSPAADVVLRGGDLTIKHSGILDISEDHLTVCESVIQAVTLLAIFIALDQPKRLISYVLAVLESSFSSITQAFGFGGVPMNEEFLGAF